MSDSLWKLLNKEYSRKSETAADPGPIWGPRVIWSRWVNPPVPARTKISVFGKLDFSFDSPAVSLYFCKIWMLFFSYLGFKLVPLFRIIGRYKRPIFTIVIKILTWIVSTILICVFILPFCNSLLFQPVVQSAALKANGAVLHFQALSVWHGEYTGRREHRDDLISELMLLYCLITAWGRFLTKLYCFYYTGKRWSGNWLCLAGGEWISGLAAQMHISYLLNRLSIVLL